MEAVPRDQILMGTAVALLCVFGLCKHHWFLESTRKGQKLVLWFGHDRALWVVRILCALGTLFGILLATGVVNPIKW